VPEKRGLEPGKGPSRQIFLKIRTRCPFSVAVTLSRQLLYDYQSYIKNPLFTNTV
jgi:hypothetical protein